MALRAGGGIHRSARRGVGPERRPLLEAIPPLRGRDRHVERQEPEARHHVPHLDSIDRERPPVHAAPEAIVDTVFNGLDRRAARAVLRVARVYAYPRAGRLTAPLLEMAAHAAQAIAYVARQAVARRDEQGAATADRSAERAGWDEGVSGARPGDGGRTRRGGRAFARATSQQPEADAHNPHDRGAATPHHVPETHLWAGDSTGGSGGWQASPDLCVRPQGFGEERPRALSQRLVVRELMGEARRVPSEQPCHLLGDGPRRAGGVSVRLVEIGRAHV